MLVFTGLSHRRAPLALREQCAVRAEERERALAELRRRLGHAVLLSTCGRVELYMDHPDPAAAEDAALDWLTRRAKLGPREAQAHVETARGEDVVRRAVRVACGLESAVQGEDEILGQVRRAWLDAGAARALSPALDGAFRLAVRTGRQARRIGDPHAWTSLAETAAAHVALALAGLPAPCVLIAGTGPMGLRAARELRERCGARLEIALAGRTPERVAAHAAALAARPLDLAGLSAALDWADAAIVALRTPRAVVGTADVRPRQAHRPLLLVDLSVPRAVDAAVGHVPGVRLRNVDSLVGNEGGCSRWDAEARTRVEGLVAEAVQDFNALAERSDAAAALIALRMQADAVRRAQLERTLRRLPHLDGRTRWMMDALTRSIVNRLLHEPTMRLKADPDGEVAQAVRDLFFEPPRPQERQECEEIQSEPP